MCDYCYMKVTPYAEKRGKHGKKSLTAVTEEMDLNCPLMAVIMKDMDEKWYLCIWQDEPFVDERIPISHCPKCGRKLGE